MAVNASTGLVAWRSAAGEFTIWPRVCVGDPSAICTSGQMAGVTAGSQIRLDAATGRTLPSDEISPSGGRELGGDLYDAGSRNPEVMVAMDGSHVSWRRPLQSVFTVTGASTDYGWNFDRLPGVNTFVGTVGGPPDHPSPNVYVSDLADEMTAGFAIDTGQPRWRDNGSYYICGYLACPGSTSPAYTSRTTADAPGPTIGVRLRAQGRIIATVGSFKPQVSRDASGVLEGFDPATGRVLWRYPVGHDVGLLTQTSVLPRSAGSAVLVPGRGGHSALLDLGSGRTRTPSAGSQLWCSSLTHYRTAAGYQAGGHTVHKYLGQYAYSPCDVKGHPVPEPTQASPIVRAVAVETSGVLAWMTATGVIAVPAA